jgi:hypothetical protein
MSTFKKSKNLLSISADSKTIKGEKIGYLTGILYLAPANTTKYNVCAFAEKANCAIACLFSAGRGAFSNVQQSRIDKTLFYFEARAEFMALLYKNIVALIKKAQSKGLRIAVVFRKESSIPLTFKGIQVVSGDNSDVRHLDDQGVIVGLYAKGAAKRDTTGFVVN